MKELSIEEKAQRYDEAIERARKELQTCGSSDCDAARQIFRFFPELKESEDERIRKELISLFQDGIDGVNHRYNGSDCRRWITWLEKQGEQKSAWSEEDESHIRYLIECLEHCKKGVALTMTKSTSQEYINWLKSLRPQNTWKPSDEQMDALEHFVRSIGESGYVSPYDNNTKLLYSLLSDLKKLKG